MKKVRKGVIGCGAIAQIEHLPYLRELDQFELHSLCDLSRSVVDALGEKYGVPESGRYTDMEKMVQDPDLDAVIICTKDHYEPGMCAARAGKHMLIEKPLAYNVKQAEEIVKEAQRANESDSGEGGWRRALQFQHIERVLAASPEGENLHVFLPFTVPPLMLPFLKEIGKRGTVRLYLMQPANGFWFDAAAEAGTPALEYLRRNAASSRATLDRLWRFTADVPPPAEALPDARHYHRRDVERAYRHYVQL